MATADPNTLTLIRAAAALHGLSLSGPAMADRVAQAGSFPGGVVAFVDAHLASQFGGLRAAEGAALVVRNLGLPQAAVDAASAYLEKEVFNRPQPGQALLAALEQLSALTAHPVYGAAATAFNARMQAAQDRLLQPAGPDAAWAGTLTLGLATAGTGAFELPAVSGVNSLVLVGPLKTGPADAVRDIHAGALPDLRRIELLDAGVDLHVSHLAIGGLTEDTEIVLTGTAAEVAVDLSFDTLRDQGLHLSSLRLELMDTRAATSTDPQVAARPLLDSPYSGFSFRVNGQIIELQDRVDAAPTDPATFNGAQTYPQLLAAVQALLARPDHLAQYPVLKGFTATLGPGFDTLDSLAGRAATGTAIVITGPNDPAVTLARGNFIAREGVPASAQFHTVQRVDRADDTDLVTSRVTLDNVGRGGVAGTVLIGLEDGATGADAAGVQRFRLTVEGDNRLSHLTSTGNALLEVVAQGGQGGLQVLGDDHAPGWRPGLAGAGDFGFIDVRMVDMSAMSAPVGFDVRLSDAAVAKLRRGDGEPVDLLFRGGQAADQVSVLIDPSILADIDQTAPFQVRVAGGAGDDRLDVRFGDLSGPVPDRGELRGSTVLIEGGSGDDHIELGPVRALRLVVFEPGFGHDEVLGFDVRSDRLDLHALGGQGGTLTALSAEPAARSLALQAGAIVGGPEGEASDSAAEVAALFRREGPVPTFAAQLYIAVDADNVGHVYRVEAGTAGDVAATLMGAIDLMDTPWATLTAANFG